MSPDIEILHEEFRRRRREKIKRLVKNSCLWIIVGFLSYLSFGTDKHALSAYGIDGSGTVSHGQTRGSSFLSALGFQKETLYTRLPSFLELNLDSQRLYHHWKNGGVDTYQVSTGNPRLRKGIETREGIFLVQNKIDWLYSIQFDSAKVFNWLGFHFGIGFHSLEGKSYYSHLGKRKSSHGCVRLRREDAAHLYRIIDIGTPVIVHSTNYARTIAFADEPDILDTTLYTRTWAQNVFESRLQALYAGEKYYKNLARIPLSTTYVSHSGMTLGDTAKIPREQKVPKWSDMFTTTCSDRSPVRPTVGIRNLYQDAPTDKGWYEEIIRP